RDERAVVERGFFIGDDPSALAQPLPRARGGSIEAVVAFEPLALVLCLAAELERVLRPRPRGGDNNGASADKRAAHTPLRAGRGSQYKACESGGATIAGATSGCAFRGHHHAAPLRRKEGCRDGESRWRERGCAWRAAAR